MSDFSSYAISQNLIQLLVLSSCQDHTRIMICAESFVLMDLEPRLLCPKRPKQIWLAEWFSICLLLSPISALVTFAKQLMRVHLVALNLCLRHTQSRAVGRFKYA
jgi:hypothetical protein